MHEKEEQFHITVENFRDEGGVSLKMSRPIMYGEEILMKVIDYIIDLEKKDYYSLGDYMLISNNRFQLFLDVLYEVKFGGTEQQIKDIVQFFVNEIANDFMFNEKFKIKLDIR